jgi:hypothetical protein
LKTLSLISISPTLFLLISNTSIVAINISGICLVLRP